MCVCCVGVITWYLLPSSTKKVMSLSQLVEVRFTVSGRVTASGTHLDAVIFNIDTPNPLRREQWI